MKTTNVCERCDERYDGYLVFVTDDVPSIVEFTGSEYDHLCKPCRAHLHPNQAFTGADDVEPKADVGDK